MTYSLSKSGCDTSLVNVNVLTITINERVERNRA
jgi:hypothetical protein